MNLQKVMTELADKLKLLTTLNVLDYPADTITPPGGFIGYPESVDYDQTYDNGLMQFTQMPVFLVTNRIDSKSARNTVSNWCDPSHEDSVKRFLDSSTYSSCDDVQVDKAFFDTMSIGGVEYLVAIFELTVTGEGQ